MRKITLKHKET